MEFIRFLKGKVFRDGSPGQTSILDGTTKKVFDISSNYHSLSRVVENFSFSKMQAEVFLKAKKDGNQYLVRGTGQISLQFYNKRDKNYRGKIFEKKS